MDWYAPLLYFHPGCQRSGVMLCFGPLLPFTAVDDFVECGLCLFPVLLFHSITYLSSDVSWCEYSSMTLVGLRHSVMIYMCTSVQDLVWKHVNGLLPIHLVV